VVSVAGAPVVNTYQLLNAVASLKPKAVAPIGVQRGAQALVVDVTVGLRPRSRGPQQREE
jgi:serine protease DegQ